MTEKSVGGLLDGIWQIHQIVQSEGCGWAEAEQRWEASRKEEPDNVIRNIDWSQRRARVYWEDGTRIATVTIPDEPA